MLVENVMYTRHIGHAILNTMFRRSITKYASYLTSLLTSFAYKRKQAVYIYIYNFSFLIVCVCNYA